MKPFAHQKYRADIDGLRAIAVAVVVAFHAFPSAAPGGFVGVDVFFVISGYLVTGLVLREFASGEFSVLRFYQRRVLRIFPALSIILVFVLAAGFLLFLNSEYRVLGDYVSAGAWFISNVLLERKANYFDAQPYAKPLLHLWSLGIEEQFYIIWPVLLLVLARIKHATIPMLAAIVAASFSANAIAISYHPIGTFFLLPTRLWELGLGSLLATWEGSGGEWPFEDALSVAGTALVVGSIAFISPATPYPGVAALGPAIGTALMIAGGRSAWVNRHVLSMPVLVWLGLISYPIYLWHWPLLSFPRVMWKGEMSTIARLVAIAVSVILAWLVYRQIERPMRFGANRGMKAICLCASMLAIGIGGKVVQATHGLAALRLKLIPDIPDEAVFAWPYVSNEVCLRRYPYTGWDSGWWFCATNRNAPPRVILLGNSFANDLYPGFASTAGLAGETTLSIGSCFSTIGVLTDKNWNRNHPCFGERKLREESFINELIEHNSSIKVAVLNSTWPAFNERGDWVTRDGAPVGRFRFASGELAQSSQQVFFRGLDARISFLEAHGVAVILLLPKPELTYDVHACFPRPLVHAQHDCVANRTAERSRQKVFRDGVHALRAKHPTMRLFDQYEAFCTFDGCNFIRDGKPLLRDAEHLSREGSNVLAASLVQWATVNAPDLLDRSFASDKTDLSPR